MNFFSLPRKVGNFYFHGDRSFNKIALTFDDGPSEETERILNILKRYNAKAMFFIWGKRIKGREKILNQIIDEGCEVGNHTFSHKRLGFKFREFIDKDILKCDKELEKIGIKTSLFRFPGFSFGLNSILACKKLNKKVIFCDVISDDWKLRGVDFSLEIIKRRIKNGSIISFHDYVESVGKNKFVVEILENFLKEFSGKFNFVNVSNILK